MGRREVELERVGGKIEATRFMIKNRTRKGLAAIICFRCRVDHAGSSMLGGR